MHRYAVAIVVALGGLPFSALNAQQPTGPVRELAPGIISTGKGFTVTFSPDGQDVYFTARDPQSPPDKPVSHVYHSRLKGDQWQPAAAVPFSSSDWSDLDPFLSVDGRRLYFVSTRVAPGKDPAKRDMDIWYSEAAGNGWGTPVWLPEINSPAKEGSPSLDRQNTIYFFSDRDAPSNQNAIYSSTWSGGKFTAPNKLPAPINAGPSDTSPWIAPDGNTLLFYSTRSGGAGQADLYLSGRSAAAWSPAENLGPVVNTAEFEYNASISRDGKTFYFGRQGKIFMVPLDSLHVATLTASRFTK
ncbi:MAG TPA: hypothetical protein VM165_00595 [Planctomycetaceae bacterium]|nr:hypothetical protein [Planctomycetaceae bacterium]